VDTGKGIGNLNHIGTWFHNLDIVDKVNQTSIGFGLNISKRLITKLGGELHLENN
jgi:signal transduction histidine kinase